MIRAGILGASGYTGARLALYLSRHSGVEIAFATSRKDKGKTMSDLYGALRNICDIDLIDPEDATKIDIDVLFTCAPDQTSMKVVPDYYEKGVKIIDLAGDFRMDSPEIYESWYGAPHTSPDYLKKKVFGLTELYRDNIKETSLLSNPGCYPTSVLLGIAPLVKSGGVNCDDIFVSSMSGISGAGKGLSQFKLFYEADSNVLPYNQGRGHKHAGEMEQELSKIAGEKCTVVFAPHVIPIKTGILSTIRLTMKDNMSRDDVAALYRGMYADEPFVRVYDDRLPESKFVADSNFCDIGYSIAEGTNTLIVVSTICNLGKGASGQAVQNMNVMFGFDEKEGLL